MSALEDYTTKEQELLALRAAGGSPEAEDPILDAMDAIWGSLTPTEIETIEARALERRRAQARAATPGIILAYRALPAIAESTLSSRIQEVLKGAAIEVAVQVSGENLLVSVSVDEHRLRLVGFGARVPKQVMDKTVYLSHWDETDEACCEEHQAHALLFYDGGTEDRIERHVVLYAVASSLPTEGLVGLLNESASTFHPAHVLESFRADGVLEACRGAIPPSVWTGLVKLFKPGDAGTWLVSRGHHLFGYTDLAYLAKPDELIDSSPASLFDAILDYRVRAKRELAIGHTLDLGPHKLVVREPYEYADHIAGPLGALVLEHRKG